MDGEEGDNDRVAVRKKVRHTKTHLRLFFFFSRLLGPKDFTRYIQEGASAVSSTLLIMSD